MLGGGDGGAGGWTPKKARPEKKGESLALCVRHTTRGVGGVGILGELSCSVLGQEFVRLTNTLSTPLCVNSWQNSELLVFVCLLFFVIFSNVLARKKLMPS